MRFSVGQAVKLARRRVSMVGGEPVVMNEGRKGRVSKSYPDTGSYRIQFGCPLGCRTVHEDSLLATTGSTPICEANCRQGCELASRSQAGGVGTLGSLLRPIKGEATNRVSFDGMTSKKPPYR